MIHRRLWQLAHQVPWLIAAAAVLGLAISAAWIGQALAVVTALDRLFAGDIPGTARALLVVLAVVAVRCLLIAGRHIATAWIGGRIRTRVRESLVDRLARIGPAGLTGARAGIAQSTVTDGVDSLTVYLSRYLPQLVVTLVVPTVVVAAVFTVHPGSAWVLTVCVLVVLIVPRFKDHQLVTVGRHRWGAHLDLAADYLEAMQQVTTVRSFGAGRRTRDRLQKRSDELYAESMAELRISLAENGLQALLLQAGAAGALVLATVAATGANPSAATAVILPVLMLSVEAFRPVRDLGAAWHAGYLGVTAIDGIDAILGTPIPVPDTGTQRRRWRAGVPPTITLSGVGYHYPGAKEPAVVDLDLTMAAGTVTALVGESGAGKSTLAALLTRHRDPGIGSVRFDGIDLRELPLTDLRASVAGVEQRPYLLAMSVADNVRLGRPEATDEQIRRACRDAQALEFVDALPVGVQTPISEGGANLSGGQRQRLALARALVRDTGVLVLDEATSHVDETGSQAISMALRAAAAGRTCLVIAHRLSTVMTADRVVVLARGRIAQVGTPAELAAEPGPFADLLRAQEVLA